MEYRIPPDIVHFEPRLMLGLTAQELMLGGIAIVAGLQLLGVIGGILAVVGALVALPRYERFGQRSLVVYLALWAWHRVQVQNVVMARVLPPGQEVWLRLEDWQGKVAMEVGDDR